MPLSFLDFIYVFGTSEIYCESILINLPQVLQKKAEKEAAWIIGSETLEGLRKSCNTVVVSQVNGVAVWRWKSCFFFFLLFLFLLRAHDIRACAKPTFEIPIPFWGCVQFVGSGLSILGHVCDTLSRLRLFVWSLILTVQNRRDIAISRRKKAVTFLG